MDRGSEAKADEAAARWLARLNARTVTTAELDQFYAWRRDPLNAAAYARAERVWRDARQLSADPDISALTEQALEHPQSRSVLARIGRRGLLRAGLAAVPVGFAAAAGWWMLGRTEIHETKAGERLAFALSDGTRVQLNGSSRISVAFSETERRIELEAGEAIFAVKRELTRPFIVTTGSQSVRALGTSFAMRRTSEALRIVLIEGEIEVADTDASATRLALAGDAVTLRRGQPMARSRADLEAETAWTRGKLLFRQTPLERAIDEVNRYTAKPIELRGAGLGARRVDGVFELGDSDSFIAAVTTIFDLHARTEGNRILLESVPDTTAKKTSPAT